MERGRLVSRVIDLLGQIDSTVVPPDQVEAALRPLERTVAVEGGPLIAAVVGPSGTGKSSIVNAFAGANAADVDIIRPTTHDSLAVGAEAPARLPGVSGWRSEPGSRSDIVLVDTPPWEHARETVTAVLDGADLCLLVVSPDRYADAVVAELENVAGSQGPLMVGVLARVAGPADVASVLVSDATSRLDLGRLVVVSESSRGAAIDTSEVDIVLEAAVRHHDAVREFRRARAVRYCASRLEPLAEVVDRRGEISDHLAEIARLRFAAATIPESVLTDAAAAEIDDVVAAVSAAAAQVADDVQDVWSEARLGDLALDRLPDVDHEPGDASSIAEWLDRLSTTVAAGMGKPLLRVFRRGAVRSQVWRAAVDPQREPGGSAPFFLGDRLVDIVEGARLDFQTCIRSRFAARSAVFEQAASTLAPVDPDDLRAAVRALVDAYPESEPPTLGAAGEGNE